MSASPRHPTDPPPRDSPGIKCRAYDRELDRRVPELLLHVHDRLALLEQERRIRVSQIVNPNLAELGLPHCQAPSSAPPAGPAASIPVTSRATQLTAVESATPARDCALRCRQLSARRSPRRASNARAEHSQAAPSAGSTERRT
jgi:hypothetical protein